MNGASERRTLETNAEIFPLNAENPAQKETNESENTASVEVKQERDFSSIYTRLKKSARKKSVSIL